MQHSEDRRSEHIANYHECDCAQQLPRDGVAKTSLGLKGVFVTNAMQFSQYECIAFMGIMVIRITDEIKSFLS